MGYGRNRVVREDGNHRTCRGLNATDVLVDERWEQTGEPKPCTTLVYWRDGDYCAKHQAVPERRCADCGQTSRPGVVMYNDGHRKPMPTAAWEQVAEHVGHPDARQWDPKPIKAPVMDQRQYLVVAPGSCRHCESTNLEPLTFGIDQLPTAQRTCPAWPTDAAPRKDPLRNLSKYADDPGITVRDARCEQCGLKLRLGDEMRDGRWTGNRVLHEKCPTGDALRARMAEDGFQLSAA